MPQLSFEDSARLVELLTGGISPSKVADKFAINKTTVYQLRAKFEEECTVKRKKGSMSSTTSQEQDEEIVQAHENNPFLIPAKTASTAQSVPKLSNDVFENTV